MIVLQIVFTFILMIGMALWKNNTLKVIIVSACYLYILVLIQLYFEQ
jgi:hypothetical protein